MEGKGKSWRETIFVGVMEGRGTVFDVCVFDVGVERACEALRPMLQFNSEALRQRANELRRGVYGGKQSENAFIVLMRELNLRL
jgi:hypothetical protein